MENKNNSYVSSPREENWGVIGTSMENGLDRDCFAQWDPPEIFQPPGEAVLEAMSQATKNTCSNYRALTDEELARRITNVLGEQ